MELLPQYFYTYMLVAATCTLSGSLIYRQITPDMGSELELKRFKYFIIFYLILVISNIMCIWAMYTYNRDIGIFFSAINLSFICVCVFDWFLYIETKLESRFTNNLKVIMLSAIPVIIVMSLIVSSQFTNLIYFYDENGVFYRGRLFLIIFAMAIVYFIYATTHLVMKTMSTTTPSKRTQYRLLSFFLIFPVFTGLIYLMFPNVPIIELTGLLGIVTVFTNTQHNQIYIDTLTGLNNRRSADEHLSERIHFVSEENPLYYFIFDVDNFKKINDTYGHTEGDNVLKIFADILIDFSKASDSYVARWGGDEFVAIHEGKLSSSPQEILIQLNNYLSYRSAASKLKYKLSMSGGYAKCTNKKQNPDELLKEADALLYENKKSKKESI